MPALAAKFVLPEYVAVIVCVPAESEAVLVEAWPLDRATADPSAAPSAKKVTVPVVVEGATVAVMATDWPYGDGFADVWSEVVVEACAMASVPAVDPT